jgi:hypothetical protein
MASQHSPADDIVYNLVSVQYHALQAAQSYDSYVTDAEGHDDVQAFFKQCAEQDAERARTCHRLLGQLTSSGGLSPES